MGLIRIIFRIIKLAIKIAILAVAILYPILIVKVDPITFYWEKLKILWEIIKSFPFHSIIDSIKSGGILKSKL